MAGDKSPMWVHENQIFVHFLSIQIDFTNDGFRIDF